MAKPPASVLGKPGIRQDARLYQDTACPLLYIWVLIHDRKLNRPNHGHASGFTFRVRNIHED
jgi:hypothetical protein